MPKRVIDFDAMWGSDKLAACAEWAQVEYAWLYGLADASGCFELTNLRVIWGRVAAVRLNLTLERLEQVFDEFHDKGLLFIWEEHGKRYGHWTGSDVPGRLPPPSWRMRLERFAPPVPKQQLAEYMSRFARGRAASVGGAFLGPSSPAADARQCGNFHAGTPAAEAGFVFEPTPARLADRGRLPQEPGPTRLGGGTQSHSSDLKTGLEATQAQDWDWNREVEREEGRAATLCSAQGARVEAGQLSLPLPNEQTKTENQRPGAIGAAPPAQPSARASAMGAMGSAGTPSARSQGAALTGRGTSPSHTALRASSSPELPRASFAAPANYARDKALLVARELAVGQGPVCAPGRVKRAALERIRAREAARSP
jgi:hypothetical protein